MLQGYALSPVYWIYVDWRFIHSIQGFVQSSPGHVHRMLHADEKKLLWGHLCVLDTHLTWSSDRNTVCLPTKSTRDHFLYQHVLWLYQKLFGVQLFTNLY